MKRMKMIAILMIFLMMTGFSYAEDRVFMTSGVEPGKWTQDLEAATNYAASKDLPLFVMFTGSDWCYWCKVMDTDVFSADTFFGYAKEKLVLVAIDYPKDKSRVPASFQVRNQELGRSFRVRGVPSYVILKPDGKTELGRLSAGKGKTPESFIKEVEAVLAAN